MNKYKHAGFTSFISGNKLVVEIPISNLVCAYNYSPNSDGSTVKRGKRKEFAEFVAQYVIEECDQETGDSPITGAFDKVFDLLLEGYEDGHEFIKDVEPY